MAHITPGFSFAFLQECFVATLLALAREDDDSSAEARPFDSDNDDLDDYKLWVAFKEQAEILRREIDSQKAKQSHLLEWYRGGEPSARTTAAPAAHAKQSPPHCHCCQHYQNSKHNIPLVSAMGRLRVEDELLPDLPGYAQKEIVSRLLSETAKRPHVMIFETYADPSAHRFQYINPGKSLHNL